VLAGMRTVADAGALFTAIEALGVPELKPVAAALTEAGFAEAGAGEAGPGEAGSAVLKQALAALLSWPLAQRSALIASVVAACERLAAGAGPYAAACAATVRIAGDHPGDMGIVASLLLRYAVLEPGQAVFMAAGGLHAYLHGTGIELLANSDNVVRAGLTGKHIDIPELLKLTDPGVSVPPVRGRDLGGGVTAYEPPAPEFRLLRADLGQAEIVLPVDGPRLALCAEGTVSLTSADGSALKITRGESCFLPAADGPARAAGPGVIFLAATGIHR